METATATRKTRSGSEQRQKGRVLSVRLSAAEHGELQAEADRAGQTLGAYVRARVLAAPTTRARRRPSVEVQTLARTLGELNKAGSNIHQLLKLVRFGDTPAGDEIGAAVKTWREAVAAVMATLGRVPR